MDSYTAGYFFIRCRTVVIFAKCRDMEKITLVQWFNGFVVDCDTTQSSKSPNISLLISDSVFLTERGDVERFEFVNLANWWGGVKYSRKLAQFQFHKFLIFHEMPLSFNNTKFPLTSWKKNINFKQKKSSNKQKNIASNVFVNGIKKLIVIDGAQFKLNFMYIFLCYWLVIFYPNNTCLKIQFYQKEERNE